MPVYFLAESEESAFFSTSRVRDSIQQSAFPLIGSGAGGLDREEAVVIMLNEIRSLDCPLE
jgi:O-acetyl-ADP-ribose deacetylase (regulator of RNase III)